MSKAALVDGEDIFFLPAHRLNSMFTAGETTPEEVLKIFLERVEKAEPKLNSFIKVTSDIALEQAHEASERFRGKGSPPLPLTGIPILVKDNISTEGVETTAGSRILSNYIPPYRATVMERLTAAGTVMLGKANMDEFAMGSSNENSAFGVVRNPWDTNRTPGGSSGGCAAAVAAGECTLAFGSDTGGSIRQPGALCGITSMKPTYGLVSRYGLIAFASSLDQIGPAARDALDCATALETIWGKDAKDTTSIAAPHESIVRKADMKGIKLGVPREYLEHGVEVGVKDALNSALTLMESLGADIEEISLPLTNYALEVYYIIAPAEASANLARYDGVKYGGAVDEEIDARSVTEATRGALFGDEVKRRILLGTYALSAGYYDAWYKKAQEVRILIRREFAEVFKKFDALITPTSPTTAFPLGARLDDPIAMYRSDMCTAPANIAGLPAVSVPCGFIDGLPVGMQIIGVHMADMRILGIADTYQQATSWHRKHPDMFKENL